MCVCVGGGHIWQCSLLFYDSALKDHLGRNLETILSAEEQTQVAQGGACKASALLNIVTLASNK